MRNRDRVLQIHDLYKADNSSLLSLLAADEDDGFEEEEPVGKWKVEPEVFLLWIFTLAWAKKKKFFFSIIFLKFFWFFDILPFSHFLRFYQLKLKM